MTTTNSPQTAITEIVLPGLVEPSGLQLRQRRLGPPAAGQVLVQMEASGVSFAEQGMRRGRYPGQPAFPFVPGYDLVGTVRAVGAGVGSQLIGQRIAAVTKTGGWASHLLLPALDVLAVPPELDPAAVETVIVNGVTAWQMLYRSARVKSGQVILVHGANGGVGNLLVQLALHAGIRVIGTASLRHHAALRALGAEPLDYNDPNLMQRVRLLAPGGVDAVFDHLGLESARRSYRLLGRGGALVVYGTAGSLKASISPIQVFTGLLAQLTLWNTLPNGHRVSFYNFWAGHSVNRSGFRRRLQQDFASVMALLRAGTITPQIAARFPLQEAGAAMELAESRTVMGKVILLP